MFAFILIYHLRTHHLSGKNILTSWSSLSGAPVTGHLPACLTRVTRQA